MVYSRKTLYQGFPTSYLSEKNDYEMYFNGEQNTYKNWIKGRNLREFAEELQQHYEQETNNPNEKSFYQRLLIKYGQKLDEIQKEKYKGSRKNNVSIEKNKKRRKNKNAFNHKKNSYIKTRNFK